MSSGGGRSAFLYAVISSGEGSTSSDTHLSTQYVGLCLSWVRVRWRAEHRHARALAWIHIISAYILLSRASHMVILNLPE